MTKTEEPRAGEPRAQEPRAEGLRALKKRQTRLAISHAATRLFLERGFDKVTIAEIAEAAQVAKMTVTNYFPRKEDLALDVHAEFVAWLAGTVRDRAPGESALAALRRAYLDAVDRREALIGFSGEPFARMLTGSPTLVARIRELHEEREAALAEALAETSDQGGLTARIAAAQFGAVHRVLFDEALRRTVDGQTHEEIAAALTGAAHEAFDLLEPSLGGYTPRADP
ncbi:TetR/AcrR family transcriptional regulator [Actinomadura rupiterrae]|uniref:TetR/AcrR family transcriptional regulator n=1 Tax=Actinomadura rupiterrae TaxID=559627 RepID=UPI0020A2C308|nr:TetR/AcrR family transcriptional regulator [Actinomadura rupiterrae]MCP2337007.1 AcrR family transcriptional regulator [Actinomadura rupiterrae]